MSLAERGIVMELLFLAILGAIIWQATRKKTPPPPKGARRQPPPPTGRPAGEPYVYAVFSTEGREAWPAHVLKAVEGVFEVASADDPTTLGKLRTMAKRLTKLAEPIAEYVDSLLDSLDEDDPRYAGFEDFRSLVDDLEGAAEEAADVEDVVEMDVIGTAQGFVDGWLKAPNP